MSWDLIEISLMILIGGALLVTWWYSITYIQPRVQKNRKTVFDAYVKSRNGQEIPLPDTDSLTIFDIGSEKFHDLNTQAREANPQLGGQQLYCQAQASIRLADRDVRVAFGAAGESQETMTHILFWRIPLSGQVHGWARLRSASSKFKGAIRRIDVESVDINKQVQIHAHPKKIAYDLFAPNLLDWYLRDSHQPWVFVGDAVLTVVAEAVPTSGVFESLEPDILYLIKAVERSGALEKKSID